MNWMDILDQNINVRGLLEDSVQQLLTPVIVEWAEKTETPIDDVAAEFVLKHLAPSLIDELAKQWSNLNGKA